MKRLFATLSTALLVAAALILGSATAAQADVADTGNQPQQLSQSAEGGAFRVRPISGSLPLAEVEQVPGTDLFRSLYTFTLTNTESVPSQPWQVDLRASGPEGGLPFDFLRFDPLSAGTCELDEGHCEGNALEPGQSVRLVYQVTAIGKISKQVTLSTTLPLVSVGDFVWEDLNRDGIQDPQEPPIPNAAVSLLDEAGATVAQTVTDSSGHYGFTGLFPATDYTVRFTAPTGMEFTQPTVGDTALDSNPDPATGLAPFTSAVTGLNQGSPADDPTVDAGFVVSETPTTPPPTTPPPSEPPPTEPPGSTPPPSEPPTIPPGQTPPAGPPANPPGSPELAATGAINAGMWVQLAIGSLIGLGGLAVLVWRHRRAS